MKSNPNNHSHEILQRAGAMLSETTLKRIEESGVNQNSFVDLALDSGDIDDEDKFAESLGKEVGLKWTTELEPDSAAAGRLKRICPARIAVRHRVAPLRIHPTEDNEAAIKRIDVALYDPFQFQDRQAVLKAVDCPVRWVMTSRRRLLAALQKFYGVGADTFEELLQTREADDDSLDLKEEVNVLDEDDPEASVVKFVNQIIKEALMQRATDIHVEPLANNLRIRYRVDGVLRSAPVPENIKDLQASVITRLKVMARLDIAEKRLPQDGRVQLQLEGQSIDVRVATIPTVEGESISLRLLGQENFTLDRLQMAPHVRTDIDDLLEKPNGIILVTGPTGCGKSTTLYCFLSVLNKEERRIVTIEDPVENKLDGLVQIAVKPEINLTFASGLRSILRGDPNVIMVGEIRDLETAEIAIRAALTGHLVLSTLHTNDSIGGITRLIDMGLEPFLVSSSVRAFMAQRLVRRLCVSCREPASFDSDYLHSIGVPEGNWDQIHGASDVGCQQCGHTGYHGRLAIYEVCMVTPELQDLVARKCSRQEIAQQAVQDGFKTMRQYGFQKALEGETTIQEVLSATDVTEVSS
ncbi:MAG: GspE/PulE family protein [Planctomycetota bacterium]